MSDIGIRCINSCEVSRRARFVLGSGSEAA